MPKPDDTWMAKLPRDHLIAESADLLLDQRRGGGKRHVRRNCSHNNELDLLAGNASFSHRFQRRLGAEVGSELIGRGDPPLSDTGSGGNPHIRCVHRAFEVGVGDDPFRNIRADTDDGTGAPDETVLGAGIGEVFFGQRVHAA